MECDPLRPIAVSVPQTRDWNKQIAEVTNVFPSEAIFLDVCGHRQTCSDENYNLYIFQSNNEMPGAPQMKRDQSALSKMGGRCATR